MGLDRYPTYHGRRTDLDRYFEGAPCQVWITVSGMDKLIEQAEAGALTLHLDDEQFGEILKACDVYLDRLQDLRTQANDLAWHKIGAEHLDSGNHLSQVFQKKAGGPEHSAASTFQSHIDRVEEMKALFQALRAQYHAADRNAAHNFGQLGGHHS